MPVNPLYPKLSSLTTVSDLPEQLSFVQDGLENILSDLYYKDLIYKKNIKGDGGFYQLVVLAYKRIGFQIPGTEFGIILNPSNENPGDLTEFPVVP